MEQHLLAGDAVDVLICEASLQCCDANPLLNLPDCLACAGIRNESLSLLSKNVRLRPIIDKKYFSVEQSTLPNFKNLNELKIYKYEGLPVGYDVISSLVTATGDGNFDVFKHVARIRETILDYLRVYYTARHYLRETSYSSVYVFNGRFAAARAWIRACEDCKTNFQTLERYAMPDRIAIRQNEAIHSASSNAKRITSYWSVSKSDPSVRAEAADFFEERPEGKMTGWYSFVDSQDDKLLPEGWNPKRRNVVLFASTQTELVGLQDFFRDSLFSDQAQCFEFVVRESQRRGLDIHFYLRVHPNSRSDLSRWWQAETFTRQENLTIIPPESPVSSYRLLEHAEKTVAFMSTMALEATFWGKPSILLSNADFRGIGATYEPKDIEEVFSLIACQSLEPKPKDAALAYGAFFRLGLPKLPYSDALDHCTLTFKGKRPNAPPEILKSQWRWNAYIKNATIPHFLKNAWQWLEWQRLAPKVRIATPKIQPDRQTKR